MRLITTVLLTFLVTTDILSQDSDHYVELLDSKENKYIVNRAKEYYDAYKHLNLLPYVLILRDGNKTIYRFDLIMYKSTLLNHPPSYYTITKEGVPIVFYTGFEKNIKFSNRYMAELDALTEKYTLKDLVITINIENNKIAFFEEGIFKKETKISKSWEKKFDNILKF